MSLIISLLVILLYAILLVIVLELVFWLVTWILGLFEIAAPPPKIKKLVYAFFGVLFLIWIVQALMAGTPIRFPSIPWNSR